MKVLLLILALLLAPLLPACIPPLADRAILIEHLAPVLQLEKRASSIEYQLQFMQYLEPLSEKFKEAIKAHRDIYYPYYMLANVYLASGQIVQYMEAVRLAENELTALEALINNQNEAPPSQYLSDPTYQ